MSSRRPQNSSVAPSRVADAAAWVAHLHGAQRTPDSDAGLQLWLKEDPARARIWEVATEVWDEAGELGGAAIAQALQVRPHATAKRPGATVLAVAAAGLAAVALWLFARDPAVTTGVGEQRVLALEDGSRVVLNTATRLVVGYDQHERHVELKSGEALFEVARQPGRPFIVTAGERQIRALGTSFLVRRDADRLAVTLVEGKVAVSVDETPTVLLPGQRLTVGDDQPPSLDQPLLERLTAWQHGKVVLDGMRLEEAIAEMNRYSTVRVALDSPGAGQLRVSGVFRSGDSLSFANAVAATYGLQVIEDHRRIAITGSPQQAYR